MADRLVQILPTHRADEAPVFRDQDAALAVALAGDHRRGDGLVRGDRPGGTGHDVAGLERLADCVAEPRQEPRPRLFEAPAEHGRGRLPVTTPVERRRRGAGVQVVGATADDGEDAAVHLDEERERTAVGDVRDLLCEVRDALDVARPGHGGDEDLDARLGVRLGGLQQRVHQRPLLPRERRAQERGQHLLARAVAKAPGERLSVAPRRGRVRERARVLVDSEREHRRLERRHGDLALGEDARRASSSAPRPWRGPRSRAAPSRAARPHGGRRRPSPRSGRAPPARARRAARRARSRRRRAAGRRPAPTRDGSAQCSSSACSRANSRTFRLRTLGSTAVEPGYRQRAANRDPNASKSVFTWVAMISSALIGTL